MRLVKLVIHNLRNSPLDIKTVEAEALTLPVAQRALLVQHLLASLDDVEEQENERLWLDEAERRYQAYKAGTISSRDPFDAIAEMQGKDLNLCL